MRRSPQSADTFPDDVLELDGYLSGETRIPGVHATPGRGTNVPLYILGSSLFGAQLAAMLGLPYAFASHFAPAELLEAVERYRDGFQSSEQLEEPYVIAGVNVIAADDDETAQRQLHLTRRARVRSLFRRGGQRLTDEEADEVLDSPQAMYVDQMMTYTAVGTPDVAKAFLDDFAALAGADELMVIHHGDSIEHRLRSLELLAKAADLTPV